MPQQRCSNIVAQNISVNVPSGEPVVYECSNVDPELLDVTCVDPEGDRDTGSG